MMISLTRISTATLVIASALTTVSCGGAHEAPEQAELPAIRAAVVEATRTDVPNRIEVRGTVVAERSTVVSSRVTAMVSAVRVRAGDRVRKDEVLLEIDPATSRGQVAQATGALAQAQAALALASRNYDRYKALASTDAASQLELDMARMQFEQATGAVEQAKGAVQAARSVAAESSVRAPFDGLIVRRMVEIGDLATPGRPLLMVESEKGRRLALAVPASVMTGTGLTIGDSLEVRLDGHPELGTLDATVAERSSAADPMTHSFEVEAELPPVEVPSGSTGRAWIEGTPRSAVLIPRSAVLRHGGLTLVVVRNSEGRSETRVVTLGNATDDQRVEILSGLAGGESVLDDLASPPPSGSPIEEQT